MKTFISDYTVSLAAPYHSITNLFIFQFSQTYYFTSFSQDIPSDSHWWKRKAIKFDEALLSMRGGVDNLDLEFQNIDKWFSNLCLSENLIGKPIYIYQTALNESNVVVYAELIFYGYVDKRRYNQSKGTLTVKNYMALWRKQTPPCHTIACRWQFKDKADEVIGNPDGLNYRCFTDHPAVSANRPNSGAEHASFWQQIGNSGIAWVSDAEYSAGSCQFPGRYLAFTSGGTYVIAVDDTITGHNSGATAVVQGVQVDSGTWAAPSNAAGVLSFRTQTGTFQAENLDVGANMNVATVAGDSTAPADFACDQSWEACIKYGNRDNFGGNRWLAWLEDPANVLWWGRSPRKD